MQTKLKKVKKWQTAWGSKTYIGCDKWWNQYLKPGFEPLPLYHFFTDFSLAHLCGNVVESCLRISISHVGSAIFGCDFCENIYEMYIKMVKSSIWSQILNLSQFSIS